MTIGELFMKYGSDKQQPWPLGHSYGNVYHDVLAPRREEVTAVLELGILGGASLKAWQEYFPQALVIGLDNNPLSGLDPRLQVHKCDCVKEDQVNAVLKDQKFDLIIDDASHHEVDQLESFRILKRRLNPGGIYVIEDIQCGSTHDKLRELGFVVHDLNSERPGRWDNVIAVYFA